jgi:uncharacterized protein (DUF4415 family)/uncharacterized DUF497 family protein
MRITYDPGKRERTLRERGLDFERAEEVFAGLTIDMPDLRRDYDERRINSIGHLSGRMVIVCLTLIEKKRATASDLKKVDEYVLRREDYDDIPELTDEDFARGVWHRGGKPLPHGPRGRPKSRNPKRPVSIRLDPEVLAHFRRSGRGWQSRINAALRKVAKLPEKKRNKA